MDKLKLTSLLVLTSLIFSCSEQKKSEVEQNEELVEEATKPSKVHIDKVHYPIPSPDQMFDFINDAGIKYSKELINDVNNSTNYNDPISKSLNFGVYTADLAYAASYEDIESTIELYKTVKSLSADLDIEEMMSEEMLNKVQDNLQNNDSLAMIAKKSYYDAIDFLEENDQSGKLTLMSLGGWVESVYIALNAIEAFDSNSKTAQRIADQKIIFGNLYTFLKKNENELGVKDALESVQGIRAVFASLHEERVAKSKKEAKTGKMVLSSSTKISINQQQFEELKSAINTYRSLIIN